MQQEKRAEFEAYLKILVIDSEPAAAAIVKGFAEGLDEVVVNVSEAVRKAMEELNKKTV